MLFTFGYCEERYCDSLCPVFVQRNVSSALGTVPRRPHWDPNLLHRSQGMSEMQCVRSRGKDLPGGQSQWAKGSCSSHGPGPL